MTEQLVSPQATESGGRTAADALRAPAPVHRAARRSRRVTAVIALVVLLLGVGTSVLIGIRWTQTAKKLDRQQFQTTATGISGAVASALGRTVDLVATARTMLALDPGLDNRGLRDWYESLDVPRRYPGTLGVIYLQRVTPAGLPHFAELVARDPSPASMPTPMALIPPGARSQYCLLRLAVVQQVGTVRGSTQVFPPGLDLCTYPSIGPELLADARVNSIGVIPAAVAAARVPSTTVLTGAAAELARSAFIVAPVYRARHGSGQPVIVGWVTTWFDAGQVIADAVGGQRRLTVSVSHTNRMGSHVVLGSVTGSHPNGHRTTIAIDDADGQWKISVSGSLATGPAPALQGWVLSVGGTIATLLLVGLVVLLRSGRAQALALAHRRAAEMQHQALHDALTDLPNRALIMDRATQLLTRARREQTQVAALFIDLDNFKEINDTLGHTIGDELLQAVAQRLSSAVRGSDTVGRLGGDEFVVLADGASLVAGPEVVAERMLGVLCEPFRLSGRDSGYKVTASIGVAVGAYESSEELLRNADVALYQAKAAGKDTFVMFEQQMQDDVNRRLNLEMDLRDALPQNQFFLVYQPTFDISRGTVRGAEALLRWRHPTAGVIGPDAFIPILEANGMIVPVGRWVLIEACRYAQKCADAGHAITMAVNVSARQLTSDDIIDHVKEALQLSGLDARRLTLEITEATLMRDTVAAVRRLEQLKALDLRLAIDDFGTGYSSLAYLRQFPVDILKIDRTFVECLTDSYESTVVVRSLVQLGKTLGLQVVAEGIEDDAQLRRLRQHKCDIGQGYLYSRPLPTDQFEAFLAADPVVPGYARAAS